MKKPTVLLLITILSLAVAYFAYDMLSRPKSPCETIFEQTEVKIKSSLDVIESKGEISIGREKIQDIAESAQKVALNLKTCCILNMNGKLTSAEFLQCQQMGNDYQKNISDLAQNVTDAQSAKAQGNDALAEQKIAHINELLTSVDQTAQSLLNHSAQLAAAHPEGLNDVASKKPGNENKPAMNSIAKEGRINLLLSQNGGEVLMAPGDEWKQTIDSNENNFLLNGTYAVYGFKDGRKATFDLFCVLIDNEETSNIKEFQLFYGNDSPTGSFDSISRFTTINAKLFKTPYQEFKFPKVTARYFKIRLISNYGYTYTKEFQLWGTLK